MQSHRFICILVGDCWCPHCSWLVSRLVVAKSHCLHHNPLHRLTLFLLAGICLSWTIARHFTMYFCITCPDLVGDTSIGWLMNSLHCLVIALLLVGDVAVSSLWRSHANCDYIDPAVWAINERSISHEPVEDFLINLFTNECTELPWFFTEFHTLSFNTLT